VAAARLVVVDALSIEAPAGRHADFAAKNAPKIKTGVARRCYSEGDPMASGA
jgi:hypothetical protein